MIAYANNGMGAVVMTNSDDAVPLVDEILRSIAKEYKWPDFLPKEKEIVLVNDSIVTKYEGTYSLEIVPSVQIVVTIEKPALYIEIIQPSEKKKETLYTESQTKFFILSSDFGIEFFREKEDKISYLIIHQKEEQELKANKIK
jgi:hypothetical protein